MKAKESAVPKFKTEGEEADWWASRAGREYVKRKSAEQRLTGVKPKRSALLKEIQAKRSVQIAIRLPETAVAQARKIAERKGIGYQTLLKMFVHEGLVRESRHH